MEGDEVVRCLGAAAHGDARAWDALVERYSNLVWAVARSHRLSSAEAPATSRSVPRTMSGRCRSTTRPPTAP